MAQPPRLQSFRVSLGNLPGQSNSFLTHSFSFPPQNNSFSYFTDREKRLPTLIAAARNPPTLTLPQNLATITSTRSTSIRHLTCKVHTLLFLSQSQIHTFVPHFMI